MQPLQSRTIKALHRIYDLEHWNVRRLTQHAAIDLLRTKDNVWETVAEIRGAAHKALAEYFVFKIKDHDQVTMHLEEATYALKLCLESGNLSWEAEQEAEAIVRKISSDQANRCPRRK